MPTVHDIDPIALQLGPIAIHWYGIAYIAAGLAAFWLANVRTRDAWRGFERREVEDIIFYGMLGAILGGRLGSTFFYHFDSFVADPLMIFRVWEGGMSFHGGLLGVLVALGWYARKTRRSMFAMYDFIAPIVPIGLGFGRIGNFIGGELWGAKTTHAWGMIFPNSLPTPMTADEIRAQLAQGLLLDQARHPSQLYQAFWEGVVMFALLWWFSRNPRPRMAVSGVFLIAYGIGRIGLEFVRQPDAHIGYLAFGWLTMGQVLSLPMVLFGIALLIVAYRQQARA